MSEPVPPSDVPVLVGSGVEAGGGRSGWLNLAVLGGRVTAQPTGDGSGVLVGLGGSRLGEWASVVLSVDDVVLLRGWLDGWVESVEGSK